MNTKNAGKLLGVMLMLAALGAAAGCGGGSSASTSTTIATGPFNLAFTGIGYDVHNGQTFEVALVRVSDGVVVNTGSATVVAGAFSFAFNGALALSTAYRLDYYADMNGSGACDAPPADHVWSTAIAATTVNVSINDTHDATFDAAACATLNGNGFDLTFSGTGYDVHNGQTLHVVLTNTANSSMVFHTTGTISGGAFSFSWPGILTAGAGEDHAWRSTISAVGADVTMATTHTAVFTAVCPSFP